MKKIMLMLAFLGWSGILFAQNNAENNKYEINDSVLIKTSHGHVLSAVVVKRRDLQGPQPCALLFYIYSNRAASIQEAKSAADHGYVGIVADVRGKRLSPEEVEPYENEQEDVYEVIDWISKQPWSNGKVGMYGGSYSGFAQWAGVKHRVHPALKTIVPYVAGIPGQGLPMENNVFINANYEWAFYVSDNKYTDDHANNDHARWRKMNHTWYMSGKPYRKIDSIDGQPNRLLQRWLNHPSYDKYWQAMVPYKDEFAHIKIPILVFDGYYNDGQASSLHYLREHRKYYPEANDYLIIGPYDHFGAQRGGEPVLRNYRVDSVALINTREITFQWFDFIMKGRKKPVLLKDRINYEVMGTNRWQHSSSFETMHNQKLRFYLTNQKEGEFHKMMSEKPSLTGFVEQKVDFANRESANFYNFPDPIIQDEPDLSTGSAFISEPIKQPSSITGNFSGNLRLVTNKRDLDYSLAFYEILPNGKYFQFSYYMGRASYATDPTIRKLLSPGKLTSIPFDNTKLVCKKLAVGSRILVILNVNKNPTAQINYGTGKDVSDERVADSNVPLIVKWYADSYINIPVYKDFDTTLSSGYRFPLPNKWTIEQTIFPPLYSPDVPYHGIEEIHFPPGWGNYQSEDYWSVSYLFKLNESMKVSDTRLQRFLKIYFTGLIADNVRRRDIPKNTLVPVSAKLERIKASKTDLETYQGSIMSFDYLARKPIRLNCRIHIKAMAKRSTVLLIEISPQPFEEPIWSKMEQSADDFQLIKRPSARYVCLPIKTPS